MKEMDLWDTLLGVSLEFDVEIAGGQSNQAQGFMEQELNWTKEHLIDLGYTKEQIDYYVDIYLNFSGR